MARPALVLRPSRLPPHRRVRGLRVAGTPARGSGAQAPLPCPGRMPAAGNRQCAGIRPGPQHAERHALRGAWLRAVGPAAAHLRDGRSRARRVDSREAPAGPLESTLFRMKTYLDSRRGGRARGARKADRPGPGTLSVFGYQMRFDLAAGFPLLTTKKIHTKSVIQELLWFLKGSTNIAFLRENGVTIWDEWADARGELGPIYGYQWRSWPAPDGTHIDQIAQVVEQIRRNPSSRRLIVSAWNVADIPKMALAPCHALFQFYVADGRLSCQMYQRSADIFLGAPVNTASYALLTLIMAQVTGLEPGELVHTLGDAHLYLNHLEQAQLQISRAPRPLPSMRLNPAVRDLFAFRYEDFALEGYDSHPHINATVAL